MAEIATRVLQRPVVFACDKKARATLPDRHFADMMHYLRWETALGEKYATH